MTTAAKPDATKIGETTETRAVINVDPTIDE